MTNRILVVDDEPDLEGLVTQSFRRQIREGAVSFVFARDGVEALAMIANDRIDMVLSDINMPRMDGLTLLERLSETAADLSTVIVSAYGDMANIRIAMNRGAFDFLTKPIDFGDLEKTIKKTLRHQDVLRDARQRQAEAERAFASLSRYFSPKLAQQLASDTGGAGLMGVRREVATLFTDIAGFTTLAESMDTALLGRLLNDYLTGMTDIVFTHEGTVTKIIGDALHVLFGAPTDQPDHARRAVSCALQLDEFAEAFRQEWNSNGIVLGVTRIGVHAGPAVVGNFGGGGFFDYTAYGDTINIAARLETANKRLGTRICVSETVARSVADFKCRPVGELILKGRKEPLAAYEPLRPNASQSDDASGYMEAFDKLKSGDPTAIAAFAAEVGRRPDDLLATFHLKRLLNGEVGAVVKID